MKKLKQKDSAKNLQQEKFIIFHNIQIRIIKVANL